MSSRRLIFLFSICFLISAYFNLEQWGQRNGFIDTERTARVQLSDEKRLKESLQKAIDEQRSIDVESEVRSIDEELVSLVLALRGGLPGKMMTVSAVTVSRSTTAKQGTSLASLAMPMKRAEKLKIMTVKVTGTYQNLKQFQDYIGNLKRHPIVLSGMTLDRNAFTLQVHLIGK